MGGGNVKTWAEKVTGTINFGSASGRTNINSTPATGEDTAGNTWTITTVGTTSFTPNATYAQIGSSNKPATSITFTTTLQAEQTITAFNAKFGGFSGTAGTITLKVGDTTVGTGSLNASTDVTVNATSSATGTVLTVTVTGISKGVKAYNIEYTISENDTRTPVNLTNFTAASTTLIKGNTTNTSVTSDQSGWTPAYTYATSNPSVATINENGVITAVDKGSATITATLNLDSEDPNYKKGEITSQSVDITVNNPNHTATFSVNGVNTSQDFEEGANISFPSNIESILGKIFVGWITNTIDRTTNDAPSFVTSAIMGSQDITYYAVFAQGNPGEPVEVKTQTLQYDTWTYIGTTANKNTYRLFGNGSYIESSAFDLSKLTKVIVYGGTYGGATNNSLTIGDGTNTWKEVTVSGSEQTGKNEYTGGTALTGTNKLRITSNSGNASGSGVRISKVEIFTNEPQIVYSDYCTTIEIEQTDASINVTDAQVTFGNTYTIDAANIEGGDITVTSSNTSVATVSGLNITPVAVGETTITVSTAENDYYYAGSKTFTLKVTRPEGQTTSAGTIVFNETWNKTEGSGGRDSSFSGNIATSEIKSDEQWSTIAGGGASQCLKLGTSSNQEITTRAISFAGNGILTFSAAGWATGTNTFTVTADGATLSGDTNITLTNAEWHNYTVNITGVTDEVTLTFTGKRGFLDDVKVTTIPTYSVTLNTSGYATYCSQYPLDFTNAEGYTAWQITSISSDNVITFEKVAGAVKGGTGLLLKGNAGATVTLTSADSETALDKNLLFGTLAPTYISAGKYYGLSGTTFVKVNAGTVPAGKALLPANLVNESTGAGVKAFTFVFNDLTTGVNAVDNGQWTMDNGAIFDLSGRRLSKPAKGINIINGKKVVVK